MTDHSFDHSKSGRVFAFCSRLPAPGGLPIMPDDKTLVIPFYALTLGHLVRPVAQLVVSCGACRQTRTADVLPIYDRLGPTYGVKDLERRLTCSNCGRRGFALVGVERL